MDPVTGVNLGFLQAADALKRSLRLSEVDQAALQRNLVWFSDSLAVPDRFAQSSNPHAHDKALSWFKPNAVEHIARNRQFQELLERCEIDVQMLTSDRPGHVLYEDNVQIAAAPFREE